MKTDLPGNSIFFDAWSSGRPTQEKSFTLSVQGHPAEILSLDLIHTTGSDGFSLVTKLKPPFTLLQEKPLKLTVRFAPGDLKSRRARLRIACNTCKNVDKSGFFYVELTHNTILAPTPPPWNCRTIPFGSLAPGQTRRMRCELNNGEGADVTIKGARFTQEEGGPKAAFSWISPSFPYTLPAGQSVNIEIEFAPPSLEKATYRGYFSLETSKLESLPPPGLQISVSGASMGSPRIELVPQYPPCDRDEDCSAIDTRLGCFEVKDSKDKGCRVATGEIPLMKFPMTGQGRSTKRTFLIKSTGNAPVTIRSIALEAGSSVDYKKILGRVQLPFTLQPGEQKEFIVEYAPSDTLADTGKLIVTSSSPGVDKASMLLEASDRGCALEVQPRKITFQGPSTKQVTIVNKGNESCLIHKVSLESGRMDNYALLPAPAPKQTLVPNGSLSFLVKFSPLNKGTTTDYIVINSNDSDDPIIRVELVSQIGGPPPCELSANPATLNFGLIPVGRSRKQSLTLANRGYADCEITALDVLGTNPAANNAFQLTSTISTPFKIATGSSIRVDVAYTPPAERPGYEAELRIASNDPHKPTYTVKFVGSAGTLCLEIIPPNLDFGATKFGCATPTQEVGIFNMGNPNCSASVMITNISLAQNPTGEFRINSAPAMPQTLTAAQSIPVTLSYKAKDLGVDTATLEVGNSVAGQSPIPVPLVGEGVGTADQKDVFKQDTRPKADIAFIIDDSCSTTVIHRTVSANFTSFLGWAARVNVDYQILVTTTDTTGSRFPAGCARGTTKIITPQTQNPNGTFQTNANVGTNGSGQENGLEAAYRMLVPPAITGCNKGFLRKDASLSVIFFSDEPDSSPQTVLFYVSFLKSLKGPQNLDKVRASAVVGPPTQGCRNPNFSASAGPRYWEVAKQLKGLQRSICESDWSQTLSMLGTMSFGLKTQYFLSRPADASTIQVKVNAKVIKQDIKDGWQYDATTNSVNFSQSEIPAPGTTIEIVYKAVCLP